MRLSKLTVSNFRGFRELELELHPEVTVLVGVNGAGKSSLLDAIALMLTYLLAAVRNGPPYPAALEQSDIKVGEASAWVDLQATIEGFGATWRVVATRRGHTSRGANDLAQLEQPIRIAQETVEAGRPHLPLAIYYPTNRAALDIPERIRTVHEFDAISAYDGALEGKASDFRGFFEWFRQEEDLENERAVRQAALPFAAPDERRSVLPIVRGAVESLFQRAKNLRIERSPQRMLIDVEGVTLDVAQLSDGEKGLLAMTGDLARRMVLAAQHAERPLEHPAVVLIDEIELHLHPGLQRTILPKLRKVFPKVQFIVSTHSPQVLSSVHAENVRLLRDFSVRPLTRATWHRDTNRILETAFGDMGRPVEVAEKLAQLREAVEDEARWAEARRLIVELRAMTEGDDPDIFYLEQFLPPEDGAGGAS